MIHKPVRRTCTILAVLAIVLSLIVSRTNRPVPAAKDLPSFTLRSTRDIDTSLVITRAYRLTDYLSDPEETTRNIDMAPFFGGGRPPIDKRSTPRKVADLITEVVEPLTWREAGGEPGMITVFGDTVVITHRSNVHHIIATFFDQLQEESDRRRKIRPRP